MNLDLSGLPKLDVLTGSDSGNEYRVDMIYSVWY